MPRSDAQVTFACDQCERSYVRERDLKAHKRNAHSTAPPDADSVSFQVEARLRELILPFEEEVKTIDRRLLSLERERRDLLSAKRRVQKTLTSLKGEQAPASSNTAALSRADFAAKRKAVEEFIDSHAGELREGFTGADLNRRMKEAGAGPAMSPERTLTALEDLHERGVIRADRIVKGGGMRWMIVGNGASDGEA